MRKRRICITLIMIVVIIFGYSTYAMASNSNDGNYKTEKVIELNQLKQDYTNNEQKVPNDLNEKIKLETEFAQKSKSNEEKCNKEIKEIEQKRSVDPDFGDFDIQAGYPPVEETYVDNKPDISHAMTGFGCYFGEDVITSMKISSMVKTEYNGLLSGCESDNTTGIISTGPYNGEGHYNYKIIEYHLSLYYTF